MPEWLLLIFVLYILYLIMKKSKNPTEKPVTKAEQPAAAVATKAAPKKPSSAESTPKKAQTVAAKPVAAAPEKTIPERVGLTAGLIWHYLADNGATSVAKVVRELPEEEKIIQRSIGWLAQEDKITLDTIDRVESLALKE